MTAVIWRDIENNKVYVKYGLETIEVPHAIAEAYRQEEARDFRLIYSEVDSLKAKNTKLRELVDGLTWCCDHRGCRQECPLYDMSEPDHCLEVSIKRELGIEV